MAAFAILGAGVLLCAAVVAVAVAVGMSAGVRVGKGQVR